MPKSVVEWPGDHCDKNEPKGIGRTFMASTAAQTRLTPAIANSTLHSVVACGRPEVMTQVRSMVNQTPGVDVIAECSSGKEALRACLQQEPDLLFIDTQIDGYSALEVACLLYTSPSPRD